MPNFKWTENQLETRLEKCLYFIKIYLEDFKTIPTIIANQAFEIAELAKFGPEERNIYENSLKTYRDLKSIIDTAYDEGKLEGGLEGIFECKLEGKLEIAKSLKENGILTELIQKTIGLSKEEIERL